MRYEWDPEKDTLNRRKHGLSLGDGAPAFNDPDKDSWIDDRFDYGEERTITLGTKNGRILYVVSTARGSDSIRIISVRKAKKNEIERYLLNRS